MSFSRADLACGPIQLTVMSLFAFRSFNFVSSAVDCYSVNKCTNTWINTELVIGVCRALNEVNMNGIVNGTETDLSLVSTCLEANTSVSLLEGISSPGHKIDGCSANVDVHQSSCEVDDVTSALPVAELKNLSLETDTGVFSNHSVVPFSSCSATDDLSDNTATSLPLTAVDASDFPATDILSSHLGLHAEVESDFSVQQHSFLSQEARSLSFCNSSSIVPEVELNAITPVELCELRPEEIRWLYRDCGVRQKKWVPFIGYDSLRIECKYRETRARLAGNGLSDGSAADELVIVRGGLYEVDVVQKSCVPIYWTAEGIVHIFIGSFIATFEI